MAGVRFRVATYNVHACVGSDGRHDPDVVWKSEESELPVTKSAPDTESNAMPNGRSSPRPARYDA